MKFSSATLFIITLLSLSFTACTQQESNEETVQLPTPPPYLVEDSAQTIWVDSLMNSMTFEEKIGQLFMPYIYSDYGAKHIEAKAELVKKYNVGGFIWMQGSPKNQIKAYNQLQDSARIPLMFSLDAEAGLGVRLKNTFTYPRQLTLGALTHDSLIYQMGQNIAQQLRHTGVHINFAPVVDVNVNPKNPIINIRSFGENRELVARKGLAYSKGLQDNKVMACAKHFPGHGDTDKDSHLTLPVILHDSSRLDSVELYPFKYLVDSGVGSVMNAHLFIPTYDTVKNRAASLSPNVVNGLLKKDLQFKGLSFTDALNMKGVSQYYEEGRIEVEALKAGNDILLFSMNVGKGMHAILKAAKIGELDSTYLTDKVRKVLQAKYWLGLNEPYRLHTNGLDSTLFDSTTVAINERIIANSITLVKNNSKVLPLDVMDKDVAFLGLGNREKKFRHAKSLNFSFEGNFKKAIIHYDSSPEEWKTALSSIKSVKTIVVGIHNVRKYASKNHSINLASLDYIKRLQKDHNVIVVLFGTPYALKFFKDFDNVVVAYQDDRKTRDAVAQTLFGHIPFRGKLPITASEDFKYGIGITQ